MVDEVGDRQILSELQLRNFERPTSCPTHQGWETELSGSSTDLSEHILLRSSTRLH